MTLTTDAKTLTITFKTAMPKVGMNVRDTVTLDLQKGTVTPPSGRERRGPRMTV